MTQYCSVPNCRSWKKKHPELTFHTFPKPGKDKVFVFNEFGTKSIIDRQKAWALKLRIKKPISKWMIVCSCHFTADDFFYRDPNSTKKKPRHLKKTAVPSLNLPLKHGTRSGPSPRSERLKKRVAIREQKSAGPVCECLELTESEPSETEFQVAEELIQLLNSQPNYDGPKQLRDFEVQIDMSKPSTLCDFLITNTTLNRFTGIHNMELLQTIVEAVQSKYSDTTSHPLSIKERIVLMFTKLKCNLSYITLSIFFSISQKLCRTYILDMLPIISEILKSHIRFLDASEIRSNIPKCFEGFEYVRVILDCTEIVVEKPNCLSCCIKFHSQYKSTNTVKFMTGVSLGGIFTYVSEAYGGCASDKVIFEESNLIKKFNKARDAIMVGESFMIDELCVRFKVQLIRPPFIKNEKQLSAIEAVHNSTSQRIKMFDIFNHKLEWSLVPRINDIFCIACAIVNLSTPVLE